MNVPVTVSKPDVKGFFDKETFTVTYVISDPATKIAAVIDPVLDFDPKSGRTNTFSAAQVLEFIRSKNLSIEWIIETHVHADHLSAAPFFKEKLGAKIAIGTYIKTVQETFGEIFNAEAGFQKDGRQFDHLFDPEDTFKIGNLPGRVMHTPGHTPACCTYVIGDAAFIGDTLFMPDYGTARCDFPGGDAATLFRSIQKIYELPDETRLFMCHDYPPEGRDPEWQSTVGVQKGKNIHVRAGTREEEFVTLRTKRDATLEMPTLILPSIQVNMRAGAFPPKEENGTSYLKIPLNKL